MKKLFKNLYYVVRNPKKLFILVAEESGLRDSLIILFFGGILNGIFYMLNAKYFGITANNQPENLFIILYPLTMGGLFLARGSVGFIIAVAWIKICFRFLQKDIKFKSMLSGTAYAMVPSLLFLNIVKILLPSIMVVAAPDKKITYYKTSLVQLFPTIRESHEKIFYLLKNIELFGLWSFILLVIAVATIGRIPLTKSFFMIFLPWAFIMTLILL